MRIKRSMKLPALLLALAVFATACSSDTTDEGDTSTPDDTATDDGVDGTDDVAAGQAGGTLAQVLARGNLVCGVNGQLAGFSLNEGGTYTGLDVDYCKAVAVALFNDASAVEYVDLTSETRFTALQSGDVDVLIRNGTWTASRDGALGLQWTATTYYDGQGMLVNADEDFASVADMNGTRICVQTGTTTEINLDTYFRSLGISYEPVNVADEAAITENFSQGACDGYTTDRSGLASFASDYTGGEVKILPDVMSKEPLGPTVREGDEEWFDIIQWVVFSIIQAEEYGIDSSNVEGFDSQGNPAIDKFLNSTEADYGLGFPRDGWVVDVIKAVGNYQEIFDRNIVPLNLDEGVNQLWTEGGLMYSPPWN